MCPWRSKSKPAPVNEVRHGSFEAAGSSFPAARSDCFLISLGMKELLVIHAWFPSRADGSRLHVNGSSRDELLRDDLKPLLLFVSERIMRMTVLLL